MLNVLRPFYYKVFINPLKIILKPLKTHIHFFFLIIIRMEKLRRQKAQKKSSNKIQSHRTPFQTQKREKSLKQVKKKDNIIKDVKNLFKLTKEIDDNKIKSIRNLFRLKKENEGINGRLIRYIRDLFDQEKKIIINQ